MTALALAFEVVDAQAQPYAAVPTLMLKLRVSETNGEEVHTLALRCQIRIEPQRRRYSHTEEERLLELFGETPRWGDTLKPFLWTHTDTMIRGFSGETEVNLPMVCTYDFELTAAKYMHSLEDGEIPIILFFSGTVFFKGESGFNVEPVPWNKEAHYRLPVKVWRDVMDLYFPNSGWLRLRRESLDDLQRFKATRALATWDEVIAVLLKEAGGNAE